MANTFKNTDKLLEAYNYLSQERKNKLDRYLKNLYRLEQAERRINWADTEVKREMKKIGLVPDRLAPDECYCSFCGKPSAEVHKMIAAQSDVFICDDCVALCGEILEEECKEASAPASSDTEQ